jgi:hypothetical protein
VFLPYIPVQITESKIGYCAIVRANQRPFKPNCATAAYDFRMRLQPASLAD